MSQQVSKRVTIVSSQANPRSTSGMASVGGSKGAPSLHFKRIDNDVLFQQELDELQRVGSLAEVVEGIYPVRLRDCVPDEHLLLTDHVASAQTLFNHLWNRSVRWLPGSAGRPEFRTIGLRIGQWLRAYHDSTAVRTDDCTEFVGYVVRTAGAKLASIEKADVAIAPLSLRRAIRKYLDHASATCDSWGPQSVCQIHGDFDVANVLVDRTGDLVVIDFADSRRGLAWEDLARVWHGVWTLEQASRLRRRRLGECRVAVFEGYGLTDDVFKCPLWRLLRCWNAVTFLLVTVQLRNRWSYRMRRMFDRLASVNRQWLESNILSTHTS